MLKLKATAFMLLALTVGLFVVFVFPVLLLIGWALILGAGIIMGLWFIFKVIQEDIKQE